MERNSTTNALAPAHQAGHNRNVQHLPRQRRTAQRTRGPQPATQLQHSYGEGKIHVSNPICSTNRLARPLTSTIVRVGKFYNPMNLGKDQFCQQLKNSFPHGSTCNEQHPAASWPTPPAWRLHHSPFPAKLLFHNRQAKNSLALGNPGPIRCLPMGQVCQELNSRSLSVLHRSQVPLTVGCAQISVCTNATTQACQQKGFAAVHQLRLQLDSLRERPMLDAWWSQLRWWNPWRCQVATMPAPGSVTIHSTLLGSSLSICLTTLNQS